jgi:DNA (cytosine-5)-methyltransferase 1
MEEQHVGIQPYISLCSGIGGLDLGLKLALPSARAVCYVEGEAFCIENLVRKMEAGVLDKAPVWSDVKTFDGRPWRNKVAGIVGGYPCQPFSIAGRKEGKEDPRDLWPDISRIIQEIQPQWCFFENVENHLRIGFREVRDDLQGLGFRVKAGIFSAEEVGATHRRRRLFILAYTGSVGRGGGSEGIQAAPRFPVQAKGSCDELVNAPIERLSRGQSQLQSCGGEIKSSGQSGLADSEGSEQGNECLGHSNGKGLEGREQLQGQEEGQKWPQLPTFPPVPSSTAWKEILEYWPELAPAKEEAQPSVRRVANGVTFRVERLRACGNSVVPSVAAKAFRTLAD